MTDTRWPAFWPGGYVPTAWREIQRPANLKPGWKKRGKGTIRGLSKRSEEMLRVQGGARA